MSQNDMLSKGHTGTPTEIQKSIDQIGYNAVFGAIKPYGHLKFCDIHGYYAVQGTRSLDDTSDVPPCTFDTCPLCPQLPDANGTTATDILTTHPLGLYIDVDSPEIVENVAGYVGVNKAGKKL